MLFDFPVPEWQPAVVLHGAWLGTNFLWDFHCNSNTALRMFHKLRNGPLQLFYAAAPVSTDQDLNVEQRIKEEKS